MNQIVEKLETHINSFELDFKNVQVEESIEFASEALFAKQSLVSNDYLLQTARRNPESLRDSILNIGAIGLTLNPAQKHAYLVPRNGKVCLDVSYLGLVKAATDSGSIIWAQAELVYEKDEFTLNSVGEKPTHQRNPFQKDRGLIVGCYVVAKTFESDYLTTAMSIDEIYEIRNQSEAWKNERARNYSPWFRFEGEMIKKTVIKRASKLWPKTSKIDRLEKAIDVINEHEGIDFNSQKEKTDLDIWEENDRKNNPQDYIIGDSFVVRGGKFRGKKLGEINTSELVDYYDLLEQRCAKPDHRKDWELELLNTIREYLGAINE